MLVEYRVAISPWTLAISSPNEPQGLALCCINHFEWPWLPNPTICNRNCTIISITNLFSSIMVAGYNHLQMHLRHQHQHIVVSSASLFVLIAIKIPLIHPPYNFTLGETKSMSKKTPYHYKLVSGLWIIISWCWLHQHTYLHCIVETGQVISLGSCELGDITDFPTLAKFCNSTFIQQSSHFLCNRNPCH